jgi:hypothetical protein
MSVVVRNNDPGSGLLSVSIFITGKSEGTESGREIVRRGVLRARPAAALHSAVGGNAEGGSVIRLTVNDHENANAPGRRTVTVSPGANAGEGARTAVLPSSPVRHRSVWGPVADPVMTASRRSLRPWREIGSFPRTMMFVEAETMFEPGRGER